MALFVAAVTTILTFAGLFYYIAALWSARSFVRSRTATPGFAPSVSILKPVKGLDPGMYEAFASHCRQDYAGEYELLFGVSSLDDPAVAAIEHLQAEFPERGIRLIRTPDQLGPNRKMGNVAQLAPHARNEYLLVNDSDIRVSPRYLTHVMSEFATPQLSKPVGLITAPYRGLAHGSAITPGAPHPDSRMWDHPTLGSKLEALGISTDFFPGVLTALKLDGEIRFGLGSTLAVSRPALAAIGGFAPLVHSLADDYELGHRIAQAGFAVVLTREVVDTSVPAYTLAGFFSHQLRWARGIRDSRKLGYLGLVFTYGLPWAIFNVIASGFALESLALLSLTCLARVTVALSVGVGILGDRQVLRDLWLLPLRDFAALWTWIWSFASNTVTWRGETFTLENGTLRPLPTDPSKSV
ncbi:MAG TPA: bacteriohopanetetrol glucosamine biosynthesis glycosyltransferase HpnI [Silvibacterium sp.]|nr:bacteriohopanetetrol glucosamine biosynthesis glycosyltransferase HpnI [Silvibacterium sp.]